VMNKRARKRIRWNIEGIIEDEEKEKKRSI
jgi:hypothetical protein